VRRHKSIAVDSQWDIPISRIVLEVILSSRPAYLPSFSDSHRVKDCQLQSRTVATSRPHQLAQTLHSVVLYNSLPIFLKQSIGLVIVFLRLVRIYSTSLVTRCISYGRKWSTHSTPSTQSQRRHLSDTSSSGSSSASRPLPHWMELRIRLPTQVLYLSAGDNPNYSPCPVQRRDMGACGMAREIPTQTKSRHGYCRLNGPAPKA
jgi:hypothetical protein